jgi:histone-lysine N-methyltransferase SETD8
LIFLSQAARAFQKGDFIVEYCGEMISRKSALLREDDYAKNADNGCYMLYFDHGNKRYW